MTSPRKAAAGKRVAKKSRTPATPQKPSSPHLVIHRLELTPTAKSQSVSVGDYFGMTQIATLSRLVEWFARQPEDIQAAVLGQHVSAVGADVARRVLSRLVK